MNRSFVVIGAIAAPLLFGFSAAQAAGKAPPTAISVVEAGEGGEAMSLKIEPVSVKAGPAVITVKNDAATEDHEMILVRLKNPDQKIPMNKAGDRVDEKKLKSLGEVADLKPGASGEMKTTLKAGTYLLFCNIKGHYGAGMQAQLVVTK